MADEALEDARTGPRVAGQSRESPSGRTTGAAEERPLFLFSVDVEEGTSADGTAARDRVPELTGRYLDFLRRHGATGTFFVVGTMARALPDLVARILDEGHEIACHSDTHTALHRLGPEGLRADCGRALDSLAAAGARDVRGYRAPQFSLTARTPWAHAILAEAGFTYSNSVVPAANPLYGWPGFGAAARRVDGILELPVTLLSRAIPLPTGGVYWRALPAPLVHLAMRRHRRRGGPVGGYFHPYDLDQSAQRSPRGSQSENATFHWLLHRNRGEVLRRLDRAAGLGFRFVPFGPYAQALAATLAEPRNG